MKVIADFCIIPLGVGVSVSKYVAEAQKVFKKYRLKFAMHSYGTNVEGEWEKVFGALKECHERIHAMGAPRISTSVKVGNRTDREQTMEDKVSSVEEKLR